MTTINQLIRKKADKKRGKIYGKNLEGRPQLRGVCVRVSQMKPKKPHSAQRKIAWIKVTTGKTLKAYIPGEGHNLQQHGIVYVRGGRTKDCPGIHYKLIRGKGELMGVKERKTSKSKYTTKG